MRIKDDGRYQWRREQYEQAAEVFDESTKSKGIDQATAFAIEMVQNLEQAAQSDAMTEDLAEILSTDQVRLKYEIESGVEIGADD